jgi:hypothetical protein
LEQGNFSESELVVIESVDKHGGAIALGEDVKDYEKLEKILEGKAVDGEIRTKLQWFLEQYKQVWKKTENIKSGKGEKK